MKKLLVGMLVLALFAVIVAAIQAETPAKRLAGQITVAGSTSVQPLAEELAEAFMAKNSGVRIQVQGGGSSAGISAALSGAAQIGSSSRDLKPTETGLREYVVARDGIAVVVHPANAVTSLTAEQIRRIFAGEVTNWKDVGGKPAPIIVVTREAGSGTRGAWEEIVMGKSRLSEDAIVQGSTGAVQTTVAQSKNAIGYVSMGSLDKSVKTVKVDGVEATEENVLNGRYKVARPFLFVTKGAPGGLAKAFIDFILSAEGQKIVARDYVPVKK